MAGGAIYGPGRRLECPREYRILSAFAFCDRSLIIWGVVSGDARPQDLVDSADICTYLFCPNKEDTFAIFESKVGI